MKICRYSIEHPVITLILNALIILLGCLSLYSLSLREYPEISFPVITVTTAYPNASAELVESVITNPLEDALAGLEGLDSMTSRTRAGSTSITLNFRSGTAMDKAYSATQEAVGQARALLPSKAKAPQIQRQKDNEGFPFFAIALESKTMNDAALTHFAHLNMKNLFRTINGVAAVEVWGQPYTYLITLDPQKMYAFGINADEITDAIGQNRLSMPAGNFQNKIPATLHVELKSQQDYENLIIKTVDQHPIRLKSVAEVKLTTDNSQFRMHVNGHPGVVLSLKRSSDANPLEVSKAARALLAKQEKLLPPDLKAEVILDQSEFVSSSLLNIQHAMVEAILLVLLIVFLFLRNWRATLIPLITIPISLIGSLIFLKMAGYSINQLTLLAMVLAVGLVVDDAIVMLENIWRHLEQGLPAREAAIAGAQQIGFAIVAMTLTLASVYAPLAFIDGMVGQLFKEFAVALAGSVFISGLVALTLSPLMCSRLLSLNNNNLWPKLDYVLDTLNRRYEQSLDKNLQRKKRMLALILIIVCANILLYWAIPAETAPKEDRGMIGISSRLMTGDTLDDLENKMRVIEKQVQSLPETANQLVFAGTWGASVVLPLKPASLRHRSAEEIVTALTPMVNRLPSMEAYPWSWDTALPGLDDMGSGSEIELVISTSGDFQSLFKTTERIKAAIDNTKAFGNSRYDLRLDSQGYNIKLDQNALAQSGLTPAQVARTIEIFFSGDRTLAFDKDGVVYTATVKGRQDPWSLNALYLTTPTGKRISIGAVAQMERESQASVLQHVNQMRSTVLSIALPQGQSYQQAMEQIWTLAQAELDEQDKLDWTGQAKSFTESSQAMLLLFVLALMFIYAILAIQFEHFFYPLLILCTVPMACAGALLCLWLFGQSLNIYTQIGLITLIGLISKHGILIVEFTNQLRARGIAAPVAIRQACALRLRPILMTTAAMVFGAIPLILSHDAGMEARRAIGIVLLGGLTLGTLFTLYILPYLITASWSVKDK